MTPEELKNQMSDLKTDPPEEKKETAKVGTAKKKAAPKKKAAAKKANGHAENLVHLKDLAKDYKMEPRVARRALRSAGLKPEGRWAWEKGSAALKKAETTLQAASK